MPQRSVVVLASGGLDSAVLLSWASRRYRSVFPVFVSCGLRWEAEERRALKAFLARARLPRLRPLAELKLDSRGVYEGHWATSPRARVPGRLAPDREVEIPGRNLLLLSQAAIHAARRGAGDVAIGSLKGNPFGDATPRFFRTLARAASLALGRRLRFRAPLRSMDKARVIRLGAGLPLDRTLSCLDPRGGSHCGRCNKCEERRRSFERSGEPDRTRYR